jgi:hypothetical protein
MKDDVKAWNALAFPGDRENQGARMIDRERLVLKEHRNPGWWIVVEANTTIDNILAADFFDNVAELLKGGDTIEVHWEDASRFATLYVTKITKSWMMTSVISYTWLHPAREAKL